MSARHRHMKQRIREAEAELHRMTNLWAAYAAVHSDVQATASEAFVNGLFDIMFEVAKRYYEADDHLKKLQKELVEL